MSLVRSAISGGHRGGPRTPPEPPRCRQANAISTYERVAVVVGRTPPADIGGALSAGGKAYLAGVLELSRTLGGFSRGILGAMARAAGAVSIQMFPQRPASVDVLEPPASCTGWSRRDDGSRHSAEHRLPVRTRCQNWWRHTGARPAPGRSINYPSARALRLVVVWNVFPADQQNTLRPLNHVCLSILFRDKHTHRGRRAGLEPRSFVIFVGVRTRRPPGLPGGNSRWTATQAPPLWKTQTSSLNAVSPSSSSRGPAGERHPCSSIVSSSSKLAAIAPPPLQTVGARPNARQNLPRTPLFHTLASSPRRSLVAAAATTLPFSS